MAIKKIEMRPEGTNDYADVIYPMTSIDIIDGLGHYAVASGTNTYTASIPMIKSLYAGVKATVKFTNANSGASTININGLGVKSIIKPGGGNPNIKANGVYTLIYDGTSFQLQGEGGEYGTAQASHVLAPNTIGTENGIITGTMVNMGAATYTPNDSTQSGAAGYYSKVTVNPRPALSGDATTAQVLTGRLFYGANYTRQTGAMPNMGAVTSTLSTQGGEYTIPAGYHSGTGKVTARFGNLSASNIKSGVNIGGVVGKYTSTPSISINGTLRYTNDSTMYISVPLTYFGGAYIIGYPYAGNYAHDYLNPVRIIITSVGTTTHTVGKATYTITATNSRVTVVCSTNNLDFQGCAVGYSVS